MSQTFKLSPLVTEEELTAMGFTKSLGIFYGGFETKKGVQLCLAIDFHTKLVWINVDNDNVEPPTKEWKNDGISEESEDEYMLARSVKNTYEFDLGFEIPEAFIQMLINGQIYIKKGE